MLKHNLRLVLVPSALAVGIIVIAAGLAAGADPAAPAPPWHSPHRFGVLLKVDPRDRPAGPRVVGTRSKRPSKANSPLPRTGEGSL